MSVTLFVYGPLRSDGAQAGLLRGCKRDRATVRGELFKLPSGEPAVRVEGERLVHGELVYEVSDRVLRMLDLYKGVVGGLYQRVPGVAICGLRSVRTELYVMQNPVLAGGRLLPKGKWRQPRTG